MSETEQVVAIGRAVQAADASVKKIHALAAELDRASENYKAAASAVREVIGHSPTMRVHDVMAILDQLPDRDTVRGLVNDYEAAKSRNTELQERAKQLRGLA